MELDYGDSTNLSSEVIDCYDKMSQHFLSEVWTKMGLDGESLRRRKEVVHQVLTKTLMGMKSEEEDTLTKVINRIEVYAKERNKLQKELGVDLDDVDSDLTLIQLEKQLRHDVQRLEEEKEEQMKEVRLLKKQDEELCTRLEMDPHYVSLKILPTKSQLEALKVHVTKLQKMKMERFGQFLEAKTAILSNLEVLSEEPETPFERLVVCEEDETFTLSASNMNQLQMYLQDLEDKISANQAKAESLRKKIYGLMEKLEVDPEEKRIVQHNLCGYTPKEIEQLQVKLNELEILKIEKMEEFIEATRKELIHYWDLCYYSTNQREKFLPFFSTEYTEEILSRHEQEIERIKDYHSRNRTIFELVGTRQKLWEKMLELEAKQKDPNRLKKAKGAELLIEENDRKRIRSKLPKVSKELKGVMAKYYDENQTPFLVGGIPYDEFLEEQEQDYMLQKEYEKQQKKKTKEEINFQETIYGSRPIIPAKRKRDPSPVSGPPGKHSRLMAHGLSTLGKSPANMTTRQQSKYGTRQQPPRARKILGENNASVMMAGNTVKKRHDETFNSITSEHFLKDMPNAALTSTFRGTPESAKKNMSRVTRATAVTASTPVKNVGTFKTPSSKLYTPANKSARKPMTTGTSGKKIPFLI